MAYFTVCWTSWNSRSCQDWIQFNINPRATLHCGAMLYVISDEMIPETHAHALILGFVTLVFLEMVITLKKNR